MWDYLPDPVRGSLSLVIVCLNTVFWTLLLFLVALLKLVIPIDSWRTSLSRLLNEIGQNWVGCNNLGMKIIKKIHWDVEGVDTLKPNGWYVVLANHQSWVDIVVLQKIFHRRIPMLKFFLKQELIWVPLLGTAWWALDFPFMKRTASARKDFETARKACEKFRAIPVSVMNFAEGTRFTRKKQQEQNSPFENLLKPKAGGTAIALGTLGEQLHSILDVTIVYPEGAKEIWAFLCSRSMEIKVRVKQLPVTNDLIGDYLGDRGFRQHFNHWLNALWDEKDKLIQRLLHPTARDPKGAEEA